MKGKQNGPQIKDPVLITFLLPEDEVEACKKSAAELNYSMARYMRNAILQDQQKDIEANRIINMGTLELKKIGKELNALTYAGNTGTYDEVSINEKVKELSETIKNIETNLLGVQNE